MNVQRLLKSMLDTPNRQALLFSLALIRRDTEKTSPQEPVLDIPRTLMAWVLLASLLVRAF
jgi:hypothetical protein